MSEPGSVPQAGAEVVVDVDVTTAVDGTTVAADAASATDQSAVADSAPLPALGFGLQLAAERQRQGLSVGEIAGRLRLHPRQIAAIEAEQLEVLPKGTFLRGFIRNYAKEVRLDPAPLLQALEASGAAPGERDLTTGSGPSSAMRAAAQETMSRAVVIGGALAALVLFGVIGWIASRPAQMPVAVGAGAQAPTSTPAPAPASIASAPATAPAAASPVAPPVALQERPASELPLVAAAPAVAATAANAGSAGAGTSAGQVGVRLTFRERAAWVEITQADGRVLFSGMNDPGTERRIAGLPPLRLLVGNASTVDLEFRGKPVDLKPHTRADDLARLTLE